MKFNLRGMKFRTWLYFLIFSFLILLALGTLLIGFIKPYYRENRINTINTVVSTIESELIDGRPDKNTVDRTNKLIVGNNACAIIYNQNGQNLYEVDSLGELCMLDDDLLIDNETVNIRDNPERIIDEISEKGLLNLTLSSNITGDEMLLYGKKISGNLVNYYLIINTPLELLELYVDFILRQYLFLSVAIIFVSLMVAFILANRITSPIIRMRKEAIKLADGNYDVRFNNEESYTEINDLATTLDDAADKLSKINELRKDLVANVSHDIKTPLTVIQSYAEMIRDISGDDPIKRNEHLEVILKETEYLTKLINDMKEYSKMQAGYIELNKSNFDLKACTNSVISLLNGLIKEKKLKLKKNLKSVIVYADEVKISQVIYNYLSNAIKYSSDKKTITINIIDDENFVRLEVVDEGDGIEEEALPYVWDRYYKIDKQFKRNENSTGLGLAIAKAILEGHKAKYGVSSKLHEGSTFYFELSKDYDNETE
ncbi:MAG: HAMP domain-containing sensor histidine kinase [Erysipelotrichaceae bacterium]|nr:HAMP domain-containing sensor histidine kinase [Erysipelotrichaceae bacterium]